MGKKKEGTALHISIVIILLKEFCKEISFAFHLVHISFIVRIAIRKE